MGTDAFHGGVSSGRNISYSIEIRFNVPLTGLFIKAFRLSWELFLLGLVI
jgi:hypothetical protein